jgi:hypothetical protein
MSIRILDHIGWHKIKPLPGMQWQASLFALFDGQSTDFGGDVLSGGRFTIREHCPLETQLAPPLVSGYPGRVL